MYNQKKFSINDLYQNSFYQMPDFFFLEDFPKISDKAIILYSVLKRRHELSLKNRWFDKEGNVYLIMKREEMERILRCSDKTITKVVDELKKFNLLIEVRRGKGLSNIIYLTYPDIEQIIKENNEDSLLTVHDLEIISESEQKENLSEFYDSDQVMCKNYTSLETIENTMNRKSYDSLETIENTMNRKSYDSRTGEVTTLISYIDNNINNTINNPSFIQEKNTNTKDQNLKEGTKGKNEIQKKYSKENIRKQEIISDELRQSYEEVVKENIDYDLLLEKENPALVEEITQLLTETLCSGKQKFRVNGYDVSASLVKQKLQQLNHMHIEFVLECLSKNTTEIRDIRSYLLTTLYNAPTSMDLYYNSKINHDLSNQ